MEDSQVVNQVVSRQATVGDIIKDHMFGVGGYAIAEKYNLDPKKVQDIIFAADAAGKFIPPGSPVPVDKVTDTPEEVVAAPAAPEVPAPAVEPLEEGENPDEPQMMTTKNAV